MIEDLETENVNELAPYLIGKLQPPPLFKESKDDISQNFLERCIESDVAWVPDADNQLPPVGFWTAFQKITIANFHKKFVIKYFPFVSNI